MSTEQPRYRTPDLVAFAAGLIAMITEGGHSYSRRFRIGDLRTGPRRHTYNHQENSNHRTPETMTLDEERAKKSRQPSRTKQLQSNSHRCIRTAEGAAVGVKHAKSGACPHVPQLL